MTLTHTPILSRPSVPEHATQVGAQKSVTDDSAVTEMAERLQTARATAAL